MKNKVSLLVFIVFFCSEGHSQLSKGEMILGAGVSINRSEKDFRDPGGTWKGKDYQTNFTGNLFAGYLVTHNLAIGISGEGSYERREWVENRDLSSSSSWQENRTIRAGAFGRLYKNIGESRFALFGHLDLLYWKSFYVREARSMVGSTETSSFGNSDAATGITARLSPGIAYFISKKFIAEACIGKIAYTNSTETEFDKYGNPTGTIAHSDYSFSLDASAISLGITFIIGKRNTPDPE